MKVFLSRRPPNDPGRNRSRMRRLATLIRDNVVRSQRAYETRKAEQERASELKRQQLWR
jgi:hypothetical protein